MESMHINKKLEEPFKIDFSWVRGSARLVLIREVVRVYVGASPLARPVYSYPYILFIQQDEQTKVFGLHSKSNFERFSFKEVSVNDALQSKFPEKPSVEGYKVSLHDLDKPYRQIVLDVVLSYLREQGVYVFQPSWSRNPDTVIIGGTTALVGELSLCDFRAHPFKEISVADVLKIKF